MTKEDIIKYREVHKEMNRRCKDYFESHKPFDGAEYFKWDLCGDDKVEIMYCYDDFYYNTDIETVCDTIIVTLNELLDNER